MSILLSTTDRALAAYISATIGSSSLPVYPFKRSGEKVVPCVIVNCHLAVALNPYDTTSTIECAVHIRTVGPADESEQESDPVDESDRIVALVDRALSRFGDGEQSGSGFAEGINEAAARAGITEFTCIDVERVSSEAGTDTQHDSDVWDDVINLRITANLTAAG